MLQGLSDMWMWINIITNKGGSSPVSPVPPGPRPGLSPGRGWSRHLYTGETGSSVRSGIITQNLRQIVTRYLRNIMTLSLHLQPVFIRGVWLLSAPLSSLHQTQLSGQSHQYFNSEQYLCQVSGLQIDETTPPDPRSFKKCMRGQSWCRDLIRHCHLPCDIKTRHFLSGDHLSYLDAYWYEPRAKSSEILMSGVSRWASTPRHAPQPRCHTGDTTGRGRPWCHHTGTLRTWKSGIFCYPWV